MSKYQTILAVCETHSISKAASKLNYTQSAVSQTIKNFEKELGVPLFNRIGRIIKLNKYGAEFLKTTNNIVYFFFLKKFIKKFTKTTDNGKINLLI